MSDANKIELLEIKIDSEDRRIITYAAECVEERLDAYILNAALEQARKDLMAVKKKD